MATNPGFSSLKDAKYLNLETFRKNGQGVRTPIWFAADPSAPIDSGAAKLYVYTVEGTGKVKRIHNNPRVRVARCDARGNLRGEWSEASAEIVSGQEAAHGMSLLNRKYWPLKQILGFFARFGRAARVVIAIKPETAKAAASSPGTQDRP
jgi:PPOX class probable F420-dependent enzyme